MHPQETLLAIPPVIFDEPELFFNHSEKTGLANLTVRSEKQLRFRSPRARMQPTVRTTLPQESSLLEGLPPHFPVVMASALRLLMLDSISNRVGTSLSRLVAMEIGD